MNRNSGLAWLSTLTESQLIEVFYEAASHQRKSEIPGERSHLVIAMTSQAPGEDRRTDFLAVPDTKHYPAAWADDCTICQSGRCPTCASSIRSIAKYAICPICDHEVYCT